MADVLLIMTKSKTLGLLDGTQHASGFWAEEFVVPYERLVGEGYNVDVATIGGQAPTPDEGSLTPFVIGLTRPQGSPDRDEENAEHYRQVIGSLGAMKAPLNISDLTRETVAEYAGVYISGGHGSMEDLPYDPAVRQVVRWVFELAKPLAVVCHGQSALLPLRDSHGQWLFAGYRMTAFSHDEEMITDMAGKLPFVLQVELERLGARYEKAETIWDSHVVEDRNLITGQNPYSSAALAETFVKHLAAS